jgi:hypothetical protein
MEQKVKLWNEMDERSTVGLDEKKEEMGTNEARTTIVKTNSVLFSLAARQADDHGLKNTEVR